MTVTNSYTRQPTKLDYASPTQFKFTIIKLPKVEYFCTTANVPGVTMGSSAQSTPFKDVPIPGDKLEYDTLNIQFLVDENLENYREIHGWMYGLGFPAARTQFANLVSAGRDRFPNPGKQSASTDAGKVKYGAEPLGPVFSDATLNILTSKNNANIEVRFSDVFPSALSGLQYDQQATDVDYLTATVTFKYKIYEFATKSASTTTTTVT